MVAIDKVTSIKERSIKYNSQAWFDGEICEAIKNRDKLLKKIKRSRLHINKELFNAVGYRVITIRKKFWFSIRKKIIWKMN